MWVRRPSRIVLKSWRQLLWIRKQWRRRNGKRFKISSELGRDFSNVWQIASFPWREWCRERSFAKSYFIDANVTLLTPQNNYEKTTMRDIEFCWNFNRLLVKPLQSRHLSLADTLGRSRSFPLYKGFTVSTFYCNLQIEKVSGSPEVARLTFYFSKNF